MAKIKLPKKSHSMLIFLIKVGRFYRNLSSQTDPRENLKLMLKIFQLNPDQTETQVEDLGQLATLFGQGLRALALTCDDLRSFWSRSVTKN